MSGAGGGLFHRLARQFVGPPPLRAHAAAQLPFAAPPTLRWVSVDGSGVGVSYAGNTPQPGVAPAPRGQGDSSRAHGPEAALESPGERGVVSPAIDSTRGAQQQLSRQNLRVPAPLVGQSGVGPRLTPGASNDDTDQSGVGWGGEPASFEAPAPLLPTGSRGEDRLGTQRPLETPEPPARSRVRARLANIEAHNPEAAEPAASNGERGSSDEVHVHIGRIEVTALVEPAPSRRPRADEGRGAPSLDDYLARRAKERS